jgi:hypothetical protein
LRRALTLGLTLLVLLASLVWAGFHLAERVAPERLRIETERRLSKLLETPVQVERTQLALGWGLTLEAEGVTVELARAGSQLRIDRAEAHLDPVALLMARFGFDRIALEGARLFVEGADLRDGRPGGEPGLGGLIQALDGAARSWLEGSLPVRTVELRNGTVLLGAGDPALAEPSGIRIEALNGLVRRGSFRRRTELRVQGWIRGAEGRAGAVQLRAEGDRTIHARLELGRTDLAILAPYASQLGIASKLDGSTEVSARWEYQPGKPQSLVIDLKGSDIHASLSRSGDQSPLRVASERAALTARIDFSADALHLREAEISDGRVTARADGSLTLPLAGRAELRAAIELAEFPLTQLRDALAYLPPEIQAWLNPLGLRVEAGQLLALRVEAQTTVAGLRELIETRMLGRPGEITLRAKVTDAELRIGEGGSRLEGLRGSAFWSGDVLELRDVRSRIDGRALPRIDATVRGLAQIRSPDELRCIPPPLTVSPPGLSGVWDWMESRRRPSSKSAWQRLSIDADWILHPALLCSVEHASGELLPAPDGLDFAVQRGVWAGVPIQGAGSYRRAPEESLQIDMTLGPPFESMSLDPPTDPWIKGHWGIEATRLGLWRTRGASGSFRASEKTLWLEKSTLRMDPLGEVEGNLEIALGPGDKLPYRIEIQVKEMDVADFSASAGIEKKLLSGRLLGASVVTGRLHRGLPLFTDAEGVLTLHARDGKIHQELPVFVAIAVASDRFDPFRFREEIPYTGIDLVGRFEAGQLLSEYFSLDAPSLGMLVSGRVAVIPPNDVEAVLGLFLFPTLDSLINRVPVLNRVILGKDENLMGAYFAMTGHWKKPKAQLIPIKSFTEGPAHFMLEGPAFVWNGLRRLESLLNPPSDAPAPAMQGEPDS